MENVEVQIARLAAAFEAEQRASAMRHDSEQRTAANRHTENVTRLTRMEHKLDISREMASRRGRRERGR